MCGLVIFCSDFWIMSCLAEIWITADWRGWWMVSLKSMSELELASSSPFSNVGNSIVYRNHKVCDG